MKEQIAEILTTLSEREQKIIRLRFGIGGGVRIRLRKLGNEFSVTRERIRQIEAKALSKLKIKTKRAEGLFGEEGAEGGSSNKQRCGGVGGGGGGCKPQGGFWHGEGGEGGTW